MARAKSSGATGGDSGKKKGRGRPSKKDSEHQEVDDGIDAEADSDNEITAAGNGDADTGDLPAIPASVQAVNKVIIAPKDIRSKGWEHVDEIQMKHPRTNSKSLFLLCADATENPSSLHLFEVLTMEQETRSWFVNNNVLSDGNLYVCTPVDPLFIVLPVLAKSSKAKPIQDYLGESALPRNIVDVFVKRLSHKQLENISIKKGCDDIIAFAYSEEKTLTWLSTKAENVAKYLEGKGISHTESSVSSNFVKSSSEATRKEDCLRYACEIVGEYIDEEMKKKLMEKFGLSILPEKTGVKRKNEDGEEVENENGNKKSKTSNEDNVPLEDYGSKANGTPAKATKVTAKEKVLQKAAQGSHSLLKFFSSKSK